MKSRLIRGNGGKDTPASLCYRKSGGASIRQSSLKIGATEQKSAVKIAAIASKNQPATQASPAGVSPGPFPKQLVEPLRTSKPVKVRLAGLGWQNMVSRTERLQPVLAAYEGSTTALFEKNKSDLYFAAPNVRRNARPKGFVKNLPVNSPVDQCTADEVAGWSGTKLLEEHKELLRQSRSASEEVSALLAARLKIKGFKPGAPIYMRIFKDRSLLQVWLEKDGRYALFHTYKICRWSGSFGPKLYEGDRQSPEGFYLVDDQLFNRRSWKWKGSFSIGYPNAYDKLHGRTGSLILVHGGCTSSGCFAMTNPVIKEVHELAQLARDRGQQKFAVHVFPLQAQQSQFETA